jgi:hypothetical protein
MTPTADSLQGFRNRIINGGMVIDQRNAGASVATDNTLPVDRFRQNMVGGGVLTSNRSTTAPTGFTNSVLVTVSTADASIAAGDYYNFNQRIEGVNVADLGFGSASAKTVTLSFWVRSSLTGTFAGCLANGAANRSYTFTYDISSADTWEQKTITVVGDTSGTWLTDTGIGLRVVFDLGGGSDSQGTAGSWQSGFKSATSGSVKPISTLNATWYITGVQLEVGSVATPFERRDYGRELNLCKRYFQTFIKGTGDCFGIGFYYDASTWHQPVRFEQEMRATPTLTVVTGTDYYKVEKAGGNDTFNSYLLARENEWGGLLYNNSQVSGTGGQAWEAVTNNAAAYIGFSAEL